MMTTSHRSMATLTALLLVVGAVAFSWLGTPTMVQGKANSYSDTTEVRRVADKLQCPVCRGQSVAESNSQVAEGMKETIGDLLDQGRSDTEIMDFFEARYGPGVLRDPPIYSLVWWMPGVGIAIGGGVVYRLLRRRRRAAGRGEEMTGPSTDPNLAIYHDRLRRDLELRE